MKKNALNVSQTLMFRAKKTDNIASRNNNIKQHETACFLKKSDPTDKSMPFLTNPAYFLSLSTPVACSFISSDSQAPLVVDLACQQRT